MQPLSWSLFKLKDYPHKPNFAQFSGYLDIPDSNGKQLHYVFVESQNNPATDPLVLWLNGGPGCSSLDGFFYEHGPFLFNATGQLAANPFSWSLNASLIYLESPAGVGFSVLGDVSNNSTDDEITASDNVQALLQWFLKFPEYNRHDFYLAGESYAGVYVPTVADAILRYNAETSDSVINLRGFVVGNPYTDPNFDFTPALFQLLWSHSMMSWQFHDQYLSDCENPDSSACYNDQLYLYTVILNNINTYNLYDNCTNTPGYRGLEYTPWLPAPLVEAKLRENVPCIDTFAADTYLKQNDTRQAFHIPAEVIPWDICRFLNYTQGPEASIWVYPTLIASGLRIWVYSGDVDASTPTVGTKQWIAALNMVQLQDHTQWYVNGQVAGYVERYSGLTFVTVKGSGHMVPQYKPQAALQLFRAFLFDTPL